MKQKLDRSLGMFSCITIGVGTMIGSGIFVLSGTSYDTSGPAASLSIFLAGIAALFTGLSFAEFVTIIPKSGGGYVYVREATDNGVLGFLCGWGFWMGYAIVCGLFAIGFGKFLNYFLPFIPQMVGAYLLVVYVVYTNIKGVKKSGKFQDIITVGLIILLLVYIFYGAFHVELNNQSPFFPKGITGMFNSMGFLYMTYIGYDMITTVSEEVVDPKKTIPRAIIISTLFVIFIKTATFFVGSGISSWKTLIPSVTKTPLTDTAVKIGGVAGGYLFALAGILATVSSINTAVMASSRTTFALSRDHRFPGIFKVVNTSTKTPIVSILVTGLIVLISVTIRDLKYISNVTSILALTGYSLVNVALMIFRKKEPDIERQFKVPLYPLTPILGIVVNLFLVLQLAYSDFIALSVSLAIILVGLLYYYIGIPKLHKAPKGISPLDIPVLNIDSNELDNEARKIFIPVSNPENIDTLLNFGQKIAERENNTTVIPIHVRNTSAFTLVDSENGELKETTNNHDIVLDKLNEYEMKNKSLVKPLVVFSRDISHGILSSIEEGKASLMIMGWHASKLAHSVHGNIVAKLLEKAPLDICILKSNNLKEVKKILFPYGGGKYSQLTAPIVKRIADVFDAEITIMKIVDELHNEDELKEQMNLSINEFGSDTNIKISEGILTEEVVKLSKDYDLLIIGAALDWGIKKHTTGFRSDEIIEKAKCSVMVVKAYHNILQRKDFRRYVHRLRELIHKA